MKTACRLAFTAAFALGTTSVSAEEVTIQMMNSGPSGTMVFEPTMVRIKPGDSVKFVATAKGHNVESIKDMAPDGASPVKSPLSKDETVIFDKPGVYGFKCAPHYPMGMVALVVVGTQLDNLEKAKSAQLVAPARKRFDPLWAQLETR